MRLPIKILFTIPNFDTAGSGKVVYDLVKGLDKSVFAPEICCFHTQGDFFNTIQGLNVPIHVFPFSTDYTPYHTLPIRIFKIARFFRHHQFQLIHSWHWSSDFTEPLAAKVARIPFVYTKKAMGWGNKAWLWRSQLSSKIIAINNAMMQEFFSDMTHKMVQFPLGIDTDYYRPEEEDLALKHQLGLNADDFVIVTVANLVPVKGIEILLEAVQRLDDPTIKVLIIGNDSTEYGAFLKNVYNADAFKFIGRQADVRPYLSFADIFVIPTKDKGEGLPIAPLEAMSSGCIVLGSKAPGIEDILHPFQRCLFEPGAIDMLAEKIIEFKHLSTHERQELKYDMRVHVVEHYSLDGVIANYESLYKSLIRVF